MKKTTLLLNIVAMALFVTELSSQPGSLDTGFDTDGKVTAPIGTSDDVGRSVAVYPDGRIVLVGYSTNGGYNDFAVARFNTDGSLDNTFSIDGIQTTAIDASHDDAFAVAVQPDDKIVVAGRYKIGSEYDAVVVRYNPDGSLDNTFNSIGIVPVSYGSAWDEARSVVLQPDGKIVIAGSSYNGSDYDFALARINTNGILDNTFGTSGKVTASIGSGDEFAYSLRMLPNGNLLAAGISYNGSDFDFALACFTSVGTPAVSFGTNGIVTTDFGSGDDYINAVFDNMDGTIMAAGSTYNGTDRDVILAQYDANGALDISFNSAGHVITPIGSSHDDGNSIARQPDGKYVVSGSTYNGTDWDFTLCRYNPDGNLDNTFGTNGIVTTAIGSYDDGVFSSAVLPEGYIVLAGYSTNGTDADFALAKYYLWTSPTSILDLSVPVNQVWIYPNPIEQNATLEYDLDNEQEISIYLADMNGRMLETYVNNERQAAGRYKRKIKIAGELPSGSYLLVISTPVGQTSVRIVK